MDIRQIKVFLEVCHQKSLTKAASNLYISQQALSSTINFLEKELGTPLFRRTSQGMILTEAGRYLQETISPVIHDFNNAIDAFANRYNSNSGDITLALAPGVLRSISPELLIHFKETYPKINLITRDCLDTECPEKVLNNEVDLALCPKPLELTNLNYININTEPLYAIVGNTNPLAAKDSISLLELQKESFVSLNDKHRIYHLTVNTCEKLGFSPKIITFSAEIGYLLSVAQKKNYVFICVEHIIDGISNDFKPIRLKEPEMIWEVGIVHKKDSRLRHIIKLFNTEIMNARSKYT